MHYQGTDLLDWNDQLGHSLICDLLTYFLTIGAHTTSTNEQSDRRGSEKADERTTQNAAPTMVSINTELG